VVTDAPIVVDDMDNTRLPTVVAAHTAVMENDAARPLLTYYDDATGERTELSAATLANWVAKTANLLVDGLGLGDGDVAAVRLPAHWQTAAVLLGCWSAGLAVDLAGTAHAAPVAFVTEERIGEIRADEVYALALNPLAQPFRPAPPSGTLDYVIEVRAYGDHFRRTVEPRALALADGRTHADLVTAVQGRGVPAGRVLVDGDADPDPLTWLVAPLLAGSSIVLCRNLDSSTVESRLATEHATLFSR
jgi:uncharacterized protein (TIGR03089 family)